MFNVPVVVVIFNRPELTQRLVEALESVKPGIIYLISDGPRIGIAGEEEKVAVSREIFETLPWDCKVVTSFASKNMGCMERITSGLDWVFEQVDRAVILEDDCIPSQSFFWFCEELLERYETDERVLSISGARLAPVFNMSADYCFSRYAFCWGWATWGRAWAKFDKDMASYSEIRNTKFIRTLLGGRRQELYWRWIFDSVIRGGINSWAYRWTFTHWVNGGLSAIPRVNLISNRGAGLAATNTKVKTEWLESHAASLCFPLRASNDVSRDATFDTWIEDNVFSKSPLVRLKWCIAWVKRRIRIPVKN